MSRDGKRDKSADRWSDFFRWLYLAQFPRYWKFVEAVGPLRRLHNWYLIRTAARRAPSRPQALSTMPPKGNGTNNSMAGYTSWESLTDRNWFGRHCAPKVMPIQPSDADLRPLFTRPKQPGPAQDSEDSTVLFLSFAQWLTDGFLMTDLLDRRRTFSSHQIDLNQLYGLTRAETNAVRTMSRGRLKTDPLNEGYAPKLYDPSGVRNTEFAALREPLRLDHVLADLEKKNPQRAADMRANIFAFAGERANTTPFTSMLNTIFLREHNRLAEMLEKKGWDDDERIFQTARNINIVQLIKVVVEEYINHISPFFFRLSADPRLVWKASWNKPNWIPVEFNLIYRWHSLVPNAFNIGPNNDLIPVANVIYDNSHLLRAGVPSLAVSASTQLASRIALFNTADDLVDFELAAVKQSRTNQIGSYNDYRKYFGYRPVTRLEQITGNPRVLCKLGELYGDDPNNVELYVGLLAEEAVKGAPMPPLISRMVAFDAFTQALTNPLLSEQVFNVFGKETFTAEGIEWIKNTSSLQDILNRNLPEHLRVSIGMTYKKPVAGKAKSAAPAGGVPAPDMGTV
jgi:Animal haem peroxidase